MVRAPSGAALTAAGERILSRVEQALALLDSARAEVADLVGDPKGRVKLGAIVSVGSCILPGFVASFRSRYPGVQIALREGMSDDLETLVVRGELDLAITVPPVRHENLTATTLWREDFMLIVPPGHRLAGTQHAVPLSDVADEPLIITANRPAMSAVETACATRGMRPLLVLESDNLESIRNMVEAGVGVALVPKIAMFDQSRWKAEFVAISSGNASRGVVIIHRGGSYLTSAAQVLRKAILEYSKRVVAPRVGS